MKCPHCRVDNKNSAKFCAGCGASLLKPRPESSPKNSSLAVAVEPALWQPTWAWHAKVLVAIYALLVVVFYLVNYVLTHKVSQPYRLRDVPEEITPWLKN